MGGADYDIGYDPAHVVRNLDRVWQLAAAIGEVALRRRGPEGLPDSTFLIGLLLVLYVILDLVDLSLYGLLALRGMGELVAQLVLLFGYVFAILSFFKLERRYRQTVSAILGANVVLYLPILLVAIVGQAFGAEVTAPSIAGVRLGFFLWTVIVEATIFARALSQPLILGFMFEILYILPSLSISEHFLAATD
jgi:hypothetical protein